MTALNPNKRRVTVAVNQMKQRLLFDLPNTTNGVGGWFDPTYGSTATKLWKTTNGVGGWFDPA
jgi:hypothetical protein